MESSGIGFLSVTKADFQLKRVCTAQIDLDSFSTIAFWLQINSGSIEEEEPVSFEALSDVCQSHSESLDCREGVLEVQDVGVAINPAKLHYLQSKTQQ